MSNEDAMNSEQIENGKKWIAALRSNKYQQCRGLLHDGVGHCCLGVAQIVVDIDPTTTGGGDYVDEQTKGLLGLVDEQTKGLLGLNSAVTLKCVDLNDTAQFSFPEIADWLESNLYKEHSQE